MSFFLVFKNSLLVDIFSLHTQVCMCNSIAVSKAEGCCSCRVDVATNAGEIIVVLSGNCMEGKKKKGRGK